MTCSRRFGYQRIETPALERIERLTDGQGGENEKLLFRVLRRGLDEQFPAGKVAEVLADVVPGQPEQVATDLATTADCLAGLEGVGWRSTPPWCAGWATTPGRS